MSTQLSAAPSPSVGNYTADETVTWSVTGGADQNLFQINPSGTLSFVNAPTAGTYTVIITATDTDNNTTTKTITVTVSAAQIPPVRPAPTPVAVTAPPTNESARTVIRGFAANSSKLTKDMRQEIRAFLRANPNLNRVVCRGFTSAPTTPQDRALARERGKVTCDLIKKRRPDANITIRSGSHTNKPGAQVRRVQIILR